MNKNLVMSLNEAQLTVMVAWCKTNGIPYDVIGSNGFSTPLPTFTSETSTTNTTTNTTKTTSQKYEATKDFTAKYEVKKQLPKGSKKEMFCISRANGWTKSEKACMNDRIKKLPNIKTIEVEYTDKNGNVRTYSAWGYDTKKKAEEMMATLDTVISSKELNARF